HDALPIAMGAVVAAKNITYNPEADITGGVEEFRVDALGNRFWQRQRYVHPTGPDRVGIRTMSYSLGRLTDMNALPDAEFPNFIWSQGLAYDGAGNTTHSWTHCSEGTGGSAHVFESSRSYYDAAGRLRVTNRQLGLGPGTSPGGVWEEYRYDALGRRVLVRSRGLAMTGAQQGDNGPWSYIERTVWDGDRIVAELRGNGATNATHSDLEQATPGSGSSTNAPFGRVQYVHALGSAASGGIDMPVLVERSGLYTGTVVFAPLTNWRGQLQAAVVASGTMPAVTWPGA